MIKRIKATLIPKKYMTHRGGFDTINIEVETEDEPYVTTLQQGVHPSDIISLFDVYWESLGRELKRKLMEVENEAKVDRNEVRDIRPR